VTVILANVKPGESGVISNGIQIGNLIKVNDSLMSAVENRYNFDKLSPRQVNPFGVEYDTDSIMHYDKYAFSKDPQRLVVLQPKVPNEKMGLAKVLSKVKFAYKIKAKVEELTSVCCSRIS